ncbi:protein containing TonB family C-terminal domain [Lentimicrobium saccharophilum]|uniref:Protein containing TonB family C-terminal domain n=1 Tax=Lentimicrobium saccharophilum TaxID=1678841 RepID=A0A0S7C6M2_9BACT|nr:energy transducer TonB [Lentimicrobium saccharophilum]GAP45024.1 protein containing TonB family C-terminal domain [Lentimicrobium saccharophilum]
MDRDKIKGLAGTVIFHALLLVMLIFLALRTPLPLPEEAGVEVNLGYSDEGMGELQPRELATGEAIPAPSQPAASNEDIVTDDSEEVPAIQPVRKEKPAEVVKTESKPAVKPEPKPKPQPVVNPDAMYKPKQGTSSQGGNQGTTGKPGDQGKPTGDPDAQGYDGIGGAGGGVSFSLEGRTRRQIPPPPNTFRDRGTVVVTIYVNRAGEVTRINAPSRGSTTSNAELIRLAKEAAMKARFSAKEDAPEEQRGTITYIFELN